MSNGYVGYFIEAPVWDLITLPFNPRPKTYRMAHPTPHQLKNMKAALNAYSSDPTSEWTGFFTDLLFVAVIVRFARQMISLIKITSDLRIWSEGFLWFTGFFAVWLELSCLEARFVNLPGIIDDVALYLYLSGISIMAVQMQEDIFLFHNRRGFTSGFMLCIIALFIVYYQHSKNNLRAKRHCYNRLRTFAISLLGCAIFLTLDILLVAEQDTATESIIFSRSDPIPALCYVFLIPVFGYHILYQCNSFRALGEEMLNFEQTVVRFGTLIMICSGESIIAIILGFEHSHVITNREYISITSSFLLIYLLKDLYFNSSCGEEGHALTEDQSPGSVAWVFAHLPLALFVFFLGISLKYMLADEMETVTTPIRLLIIVAVEGTLLVGILMRSAHKLFTFSTASILFRGPLLVALPFGIAFTDVADLIMWCTAFILLNTFVDKFLIYVWHSEIADEFLEFGSDGDSDQISIRTLGESSDAPHVKKFKGNRNEYPLYRLVIDFIFCNTKSAYTISLQDHAAKLQEVEKRGPDQPLYHDVYSLRDRSKVDIHNHIKHTPGEDGILHEIQLVTSKDHAEKLRETKAAQADHDDKKHAHEHDHSHGWFGEFCDIVLAAIVIKFAHYIHHNLIEDASFSDFPKLLGESIVGYFGFWILWLELTCTFCRIRNIKGNVDDLFYFLILLGNAIMGLTLNGHGLMFEDADGYIFGMLISLSSLFWLHVYVYMMVPSASKYCLRRLAAYFITIIMNCVGLWYNKYSTQMSCVCATVFVHGWISINSFRVFDGVHLTFEQFVERFGLFVMVLSGESILALVLMPDQLDWEVYGAIFIGLLIMFHMKNIYFWSNVELEAGHALIESNSPGSCMWVVAHACLGYFLMMIGVSFKIFFDDLNGNGYHKTYAELMVWSFVGSLFCMNVIRASHAAFTTSCLSYFIRLPSIAAFPVGVYGGFIHRPITMLLWCECWMLIANIIDYALESSEVVPFRKETRGESTGGASWISTFGGEETNDFHIAMDPLERQGPDSNSASLTWSRLGY